MSIRRSATTGLVLAMIVLAAACGAPGPGPSAAQEVSIVQLDLVDATRPTAATDATPGSPTRALPTTVYLPPGGGRAPLILLAHGAGGAPEKFTELASAWANHGYVVAVPRFPLTNDTVVPPVLGDFPEQGRDVRFVIDEVLAGSADAGAGALAGRVDPDRLGLFGLSLGSLTVWSEVFGDAPDPRVDALIQSDGTTFVPDEVLDAIAFPVLVAHSDADAIFPYAETVARYDRLPGRKYLLTLHGAGHATVGENTVTPADVNYHEITTVFWDRTLGNRPDEPFPAPIDGVTSFVEGPRPDRGRLPGTR